MELCADGVRHRLCIHRRGLLRHTAIIQDILFVGGDGGGDGGGGRMRSGGDYSCVWFRRAFVARHNGRFGERQANAIKRIRGAVYGVQRGGGSWWEDLVREREREI